MKKKFEAGGKRLESVRLAFGEDGSRTTMLGFQRELGLGDTNPGLYRGWELGHHEPNGRLDGLAACFARVAGIRKAGADPRALAVWVYMGQGEMPAGKPPRGPGRGKGLHPTLEREIARPLPATLDTAIDELEAKRIDRATFKRILRAFLPGLDSNQEFENATVAENRRLAS